MRRSLQPVNPKQRGYCWLWGHKMILYFIRWLLSQPFSTLLKQTSVHGAARGLQQRQAGRDWYQTLSTFLLDEGFTRSSNDFCLFMMRGTNDAMIYVLVWVNDIIIGCRYQDEVDKLRSRFSVRFKMDDRGALSWRLGMQVKRSPGTVTVNQSRYIEDCLEHFGLADCKP